ncbi:YkgJ family cysteine cluster protein [Streptomyces albus]|uniref:YkgJ family cysteine cluster protein n=1 Tax=Streptomyces albus TaxID=1888 RepID=UPI003F1AD313
MSGSGANLAGCASCKGRCCREYTVNVTVADIRKLATGMALHPREFVALKEKDDGDFRLRPGGPKFDLRLKHRPVTEGCVFLMEIAPGHARCGAYAHRPRVCANFPAALIGNTVTIRSDTLCGGSDSWNLTAMDLPALRANIMRNKAAWREHLRIAEQWNARVEGGWRTRSEDELFAFILAAEQQDSAERSASSEPSVPSEQPEPAEDADVPGRPGEAAGPDGSGAAEGAAGDVAGTVVADGQDLGDPAQTSA